MIQAQILADIKESMKSGDRERLEALRLANAQVHNREIEKRSKGDESPLTDDEVLDVLRKEVKKRRDAIEMFQSGGRTDLAEKEEKEMTIIASYLPAAPTDEAMRTVIADLRAKGVTEFGALMKEAKTILPAADGAALARIAKEG